MVFRLKIGLFSAYLSVVVVVVNGQANQCKPPETHFPESKTSTNRGWRPAMSAAWGLGLVLPNCEQWRRNDGLPQEGKTHHLLPVLFAYFNKCTYHLGF